MSAPIRGSRGGPLWARVSAIALALLCSRATFAQDSAAAQNAQAAGAQSSAAETNSAQTPANANAEKSATASQSSPVRVRATHRVEVIAPGEHVETIIDRMRATAPGAAAATGSAGSLQVRPLDGDRAAERASPADRAQQHAGHGAAGPASGPPQGGGGPPPERR